MTDRQHRDAITGQYVTAEDATANPDTTVSEQRVRRPASDDSAAATPTLALDALRDYSRRARAAAAFVDTPGALTDALDKLDALIAHAEAERLHYFADKYGEAN